MRLLLRIKALRLVVLSRLEISLICGNEGWNGYFVIGEIEDDQVGHVGDGMHVHDPVGRGIEECDSGALPDELSIP